MNQKEDTWLKTLIRWLCIIIGIKLIIICFVFLRFAEKSNEYIGINVVQDPQFCFNGQCINLEIAQSDEERALGLMFRESLGKDEWMVFLFPKEDYHGMWMRNVRIPLDILWINKENKVVHIVSAPPCEEDDCISYKSQELNSFAIELNSWEAKNLWIGIWDIVELKGITFSWSRN